MLFTPIKPMLLSASTEAFNNDRYIFEPKFDGFRILIHKQGSRIEAFTRNGNRVTEKFPELQEAVSSITVNTAILDCEGVVLRDGRPVFDDFAYRGRLHDPTQIKRALKSHPATFVGFDVLMTYKEHISEQLIERKRRLEDIIVHSKVLSPTMYVNTEGVKLKQLTEQRDWEGIVAKRKDSRYLLNTRSDNWLKIKNFKLIDTVILGYRLQPTFALIVGANFKTIRNKPVAVVQFGMSRDQKQAFLAIAKDIKLLEEKGIQWIKPLLCCRVQYLERTETHKLRTTSFKGFLFNKAPEDCRWVI